MHDAYDRSSKWLLTHHGDSILRLCGVQNIRSWRPLHPEVVQPKQLPDGLLEVEMEQAPVLDLFIMEIATYPEERILEQVARGAMLVYLDRRRWPEVVTLVLRPHGHYHVEGSQQHVSRLGHTRFELAWTVVELWTLSAEDLVTAQDVGLVPWAPLASFDGPPEPLLERCRDRINQDAAPEERANMLAVAQVLARLRYTEGGLLNILGGKQAMIESPLIQEIVAEKMQKTILIVLKARFGAISPETAGKLHEVTDEARLDKLAELAGTCSDLETFHKELASQPAQ